MPHSGKLKTMSLPRTEQMQLDRFLDRLRRDAELEIGYPVAFDFDYSALAPFLAFSLNNAGDPFMPMTYLLNSHEFEQELTDRALRRLQAGQDPAEVLQQMANTLTNKILHLPSKRLREAAEERDYAVLKAADRIFRRDGDEEE